MEPILLASASPRRRELLEARGIPLVVAPADADESVFDAFPPRERVEALAGLKADAVLPRLAAGAPRWIVAADTLVALEDPGRPGTWLTLGKPADEAEARRFLELLSGRTHSVFTGLCALDRAEGRKASRVNETRVTFSPLSEREIDWYLGTGEWRDVAGAYRAQERAGYFVERVEGSFSGVVGLPLADFYGIMAALGYRFR